jgi:hypothetical protein
VGFDPTIPAFEQAKTFHALDRAPTVIGKNDIGITKHLMTLTIPPLHVVDLHFIWSNGNDVSLLWLLHQ